MSEVSAAPATPDTAAPSVNAPEPKPKLADKFDGPEALIKGVQEAHKLLNLEPLAQDNPILANVEATEAYYKTINKMIGRGLHKLPDSTTIQAAPDNSPKTPAPAPDATAPTQPPAKATPEEALKAAGLTEQQIANEWGQNGDLSADTYAKLEKAGVSKEEVRAEVEKRKAATWAAGDEVAGSRENHEAMRKWSIENIKGPDAVALNALSSNPATYKQAVEFMKIRYDASSIGADTSGTLIIGRGAPNNPEPEAKTQDEVSALLRAARTGDRQAIEEFGKRVSFTTLSKLTNR